MRAFYTILLLLLAFSSYGFSIFHHDQEKENAYSERYINILHEQLGAYENGPLAQQLDNKDFKLGAPVYIRVFKKDDIDSVNTIWRRHKDYGSLEVWIKKGRKYELFKRYKVRKHSGVVGPKLREGDYQVPEGFYTLDFDWLNFRSRFHLAMNIGYPNEFDRYYHRSGSAIMVHGSNRSVGCLAMGDYNIEEIFILVEKALKLGRKTMPIHIFPFKLTAANMQRAKEKYPQHYAFWQMLKPAYDIFEKERIPAKVKVKEGKYIIKKRFSFF